MTDKEVMQMALDAMEQSRVFVTTREKIKHPEGTEWYDERIEALRAALAQGEQEPVAWVDVNYDGECEIIEYGKPPDDPSVTPLYPAPPQREWQNLTDEDWEEIIKRKSDKTGCEWDAETYDVIEAKLKEKNHGR